MATSPTKSKKKSRNSSKTRAKSAKRPKLKKIDYTLIISFLLILSVFAFMFLDTKYNLTGYAILEGVNEYTQDLNWEINNTQTKDLSLVEHTETLFYLRSIKLAGSLVGEGSAKVYLVSAGEEFLVFDSNKLPEKQALIDITGFTVEEIETKTVEAEPTPEPEPEVPAEETVEEPQPETEVSAEPTTSEPAEEPVVEDIEAPLIEEEPTIEEQPTEEPIVEEPVEEPVVEEEVIPPVETVQKIDFPDACVETCILPEGIFDQDTYELAIYIEGDAVLYLSQVKYAIQEIEIPEMNITNATYAFKVDIKDAEDKSVPARIEFIDPDTEEIEFEDEITEQEAEVAPPAPPGPQRAAPQVPTEAEKPIDLDVPEGRYNIKIKPQNHPIKEIEFEDIDINQNITEFVDIDDTPEFENYVEVYAIDPTQFNFTFATVTVTAKGTALYKCKDWDFTEQTCFGEWTFLQSIIPGQGYTFTLTPEDPAFAERVTQIECYSAGVLVSCTVSEVNASDNTYAYSTLEYLDSYQSLLAQAHTWHNQTDVPDGSTIDNVTVNIEWYVADDKETCSIEVYEYGTGWHTLSTTCTEIEALYFYDASTYINTEAEAENVQVRINYTSVAPTDSASDELYVDWIYVNVTYTTPVDYPPYWLNNQTNIVTTYSPTTSSYFNITWQDDFGIDAVYFESDYSGSPTNYSMANIGGDVYQYSAILPAGSYYWKSHANDTADQWNTTDTWAFTINKATSSCSLTFDPATPQTYGTAINASCSCTNPEASASLYRGGVDVTAGEAGQFTVLPAQTHNYVCNVTSTQNYTSAQDTGSYTINKAASAVNLLLNGQDDNITINQYSSVNTTATREAGEGIIYLHKDGQLVASGTGPLVNTSDYDYVGLFNATVEYLETQNYTASEETHWITVRDYTPPVVNLEAPENGATDTDGNVTFEYNVADFDSGIANCSLIIDGSIDQTDNSITEATTQTFTKTGLATANYTWSVNCTDDSVNANEGASETRNLIVDLPQGISLTDPADQNTNRTINATYTITITNTGLETDNFSLSLENIDTADVSALNQTQILNLGSGQSAQVELDVTDNNQVGTYITNITAQSALDASVSNEIEITTTVYGILSAYVTEPTGTPRYYADQNVTFKGYVYDELANSIDGATVTFEPINGSYTYICSNSLGEGSGVYNCTLDTTGMMAPRTYDVRINATKTYYHLGSYTNTSIFFLESSQAANLDLQKIPSVQDVNSSQISYNVTLYLTNGRGTSENTTLTDPDAGQTWDEGTVLGAQTITESYTLTYDREAADQTITLNKANATGYDPLYNKGLFTESNQPVIIVPENESLIQLTLTKNIIIQNQTTTNITYLIVDEIVNSGDENLTGISVVDSDIDLTTAIDLAEGESWSTNGTKLINKNSQSYTHNFTKVSAFANSIYYYSNQLSVVIPGYGGPYDVVIVTLPSSVTTGNQITGSVEVINQNTEISEDRTLTTWIETPNGTVLDLDIRTIFVGRNQSATFDVTLTAPSTPGTYNFVSELVWPTASASASKSFSVVSPAVAEEAAAGAAAAGVIAEEVEVAALPTEVIQPIAEIPQDIIADLIRLINSVRDLERQALDEHAELLLTDIKELITQAEDAAAKGRYDEARNHIRTAYGKLQILIEIAPITAFAITLPAYTRSVLTIIMLAAVLTAIFIIGVLVKRKWEVATEIQFLNEEREHLEKLNEKIDRFINKMKRR